MRLFRKRKGVKRDGGPTEGPSPLTSCANARDLGGYPVCGGGTTLMHRFVRCGGTRSLTRRNLDALVGYGITRVLDLRGEAESPRLTCAFAHRPDIVWENVSLFDTDISAPAVLPAHDTNNYLVSSYLHMLAAPVALGRIFDFFAQAGPSECILFHCAAGMDRTGMVAMLLLGLAAVPRTHIVADYGYSFAPRAFVDAAVAAGGVVRDGGVTSRILQTRLDAIGEVYDAVVQTHGSVREFLRASGIADDTLDAVRAHLVGPSAC